MATIATEKVALFEESVNEFRNASPLFKREKRDRLLSQVDRMARSRAGMDFLEKHIEQLVNAGIFAGTVWENPQNLQSGLVQGTLLAGHPSSTSEILSELRMTGILQERLFYTGFGAPEARKFIQDVLVQNFVLAFEEFQEPFWKDYKAGELKKIRLLFDRLLELVPVKSFKERLLEEIELVAAQRPIVNNKLEKMVRAVDQQVQTDRPNKIDQQLRWCVNAFFAPTDLAAEHRDPDAYRNHFRKLHEEEQVSECREIGQKMASTGLVSSHQLALLEELSQTQPALISELLALSPLGVAELEHHQDFVLKIIDKILVPATRQTVYGLSRILERNLLSRSIIWNALDRLLQIKLHPEVAENIQKANHSQTPATSEQLLVADTLNVLGHPLGIRQGNNPTCQSARAISMWSQHAPGKLINLLMDAATHNRLVFRYEGDLIDSGNLVRGVAARIDYQLDSVSIVMVPQLDKIYQAMMERAMVKHIGKDPHISVNPAFYGHWIQTGFISAYNPLTHLIDNYDEFVRIFYASYHPDYNGGRRLVYPVPVGIFITDKAANFLGFHAISLLRVDKDSEGEWRIYFFNPNSVGRQDWGQGIRPEVTGKGEKPGESSLPFAEMTSRLYAYHYNSLRVKELPRNVPNDTVKRIAKLARESWGRKYRWTNF